MTTFSRQKIFAQAAKKLRQDFGELSTVPHRALKGHEAEKLVRTFLAGHLPKRFGVGSGFIIDHNDSVSKQTDVIIYDAHNCPVYRVSDDAAIFPNENVAAVVEVKARLDREKLSEAANIRILPPPSRSRRSRRQSCQLLRRRKRSGAFLHSKAPSAWRRLLLTTLSTFARPNLVVRST
jgi:hypothetical protein